MIEASIVFVSILGGGLLGLLLGAVAMSKISDAEKNNKETVIIECDKLNMYGCDEEPDDTKEVIIREGGEK